MNEELTFLERLNRAQTELKAPKGQYNNFGKYKYRSAEDILEAVKPINNQYNLNLTLSDCPQLIGNNIYIEATATLTDALNPTNQIVVKAYAKEPISKKGMDDSQITGAASSYARKYALNGLYLIDDTKDADSNEHKTEVDATTAKKISDIQAKALRQKVENLVAFISEKTGKEQNFDDIYAYLSDQKFAQIITIENLDTEQLVTINRYADEMRKKYEKMK